MTNQGIVSILTTLIAVIGTLAGVIITYYFTNRMERKRILREKLEEIYTLAIQVKQWLDNEIKSWWSLIDPNAQSHPYKDLSCPIEQLIMLVELYAPSLAEKAVRINKKVLELKQRYSVYSDEKLIAFNNERPENVLRQDDTEITEMYTDLVVAVKKLIKKY